MLGRGLNIFYTILMPTSIHIPTPLLVAINRRASALNISRNRYIVRVLTESVQGGSGWSQGFFELLRPLDRDGSEAIDDMLSAIARHRKSKKAPRLTKK